MAVRNEYTLQNKFWVSRCPYLSYSSASLSNTKHVPVSTKKLRGIVMPLSPLQNLYDWCTQRRQDILEKLPISSAFKYLFFTPSNLCDLVSFSSSDLFSHQIERRRSPRASIDESRASWLQRLQINGMQCSRFQFCDAECKSIFPSLRSISTSELVLSQAFDPYLFKVKGLGCINPSCSLK